MNENIKELLWRQAEPTVYIGREEFLRSLDGWTIEPVMIENVLAGAVLTKGAQIHFATFGTGHKATMGIFLRFLKPVIDTHGYAMTLTPKTDLRQRRFNDRFGFKIEGEDEFFVHYRIERLPRDRARVEA